MDGTKLKSVPFHQWQLKMIFGESVFPRSHISNMTQLDFFLDILPIYQLDLIVNLTNADLKRVIFPATTSREMINCFSVLILIMRYEFSSRRDMWSSKYQCKCIKLPGKVTTGLLRPSFDHLWPFVQFSRHQHPRP